MTIRFDTRWGPIGALMGATIMRRKINQQSALGLAGLKQFTETGTPIGGQEDLAPATLAAVA